MSVAQRLAFKVIRSCLITKTAEYPVCWVNGNDVYYVDAEGKECHDIIVSSSVISCRKLD